MIKSLQERFDEKYEPVTESGCWIWTACSNGDGYGLIAINSQPSRAHRVSWSLHKGIIPDGVNVLHKCDNPSCVNPDHLFLGTQQDNVTDMIQKNRHNHRGEANGKAKLNDDKVREIRLHCDKSVTVGNTDSSVYAS